MGIDLVSIVVGSERNYMHLFYKDDMAFCIDACDEQVLLKALGVEFKKSIYSGEEILEMDEDRGKRRELVYVFSTHKHQDHTEGLSRVMEESPKTRSISGFGEDACKCGDIFKFGEVEIECLYTPCHTTDSFCYYIDGRYLATGDTLLFLGCGRFFEGTSEQMLQAIAKIKARVNADALMLYGHEYNEQNTLFTSGFYYVPEEIEEKTFLTLSEETEYNPFFNLQKVSIKGSEEEIMAELRKRKDQFNRTIGDDRGRSWNGH